TAEPAAYHQPKPTPTTKPAPSNPWPPNQKQQRDLSQKLDDRIGSGTRDVSERRMTKMLPHP
ncbi:hypothetical protein, partial [Paenarthrobacter sp. MSM-2-10-13]|uniref:hypothetical protein n=1 Tax=Paenarthrobacter sp. MSM-2-10-13 TaxID=2717318 RepID=UPI001AA0B372